MTGRVRIRRLDSPPIPSLETGDPEIDSYLTRAWEETQWRNSVTYLLYLDDIPAGYASISMKSLHCELPQGKWSWPALLLGRLGIDKQFQGKPLFEGMTGGIYLLKYVVGLALDLGQRVGCRLVILDTYSERLERYYHRFGFEAAKKTQTKISMFLDLLDPLAVANT